MLIYYDFSQWVSTLECFNLKSYICLIRLFKKVFSRYETFLHLLFSDVAFYSSDTLYIMQQNSELSVYISTSVLWAFAMLSSSTKYVMYVGTFIQNYFLLVIKYSKTIGNDDCSCLAAWCIYKRLTATPYVTTVYHCTPQICFSSATQQEPCCFAGCYLPGF